MSVSNFLWNKWCRSFKMLDGNKDGYLTGEDFAGVADFLSRKMNASPEEAEITRAAWAGWFPRIRPDPSVDKMDVYVHNIGMSKLYLKDTKLFQEELSHTFSDLFDNLDLNKDGEISFDEWELFYEAFEITDKRFVKEMFAMIDKNGNGIIERSEYVTALVQYFTSPEEPDKFEYMWDPTYGRDKPEGFR